MKDLLDPNELEDIKVKGDTEQSEQVEDTEHQLLSDDGSSKKQLTGQQSLSYTFFRHQASKHYLIRKLVQDLEFVEMEEFLPSNRMIQAIENPVSYRKT